MKKTSYIAFARAMGRIPLTCRPRVTWKLVHTFALPAARALQAFERRQAAGEPFFPAFLMISITERCNLACSGCWVTRGGRKSLSLEQLDGIIRETKRRGCRFIGLLGGEPLLYKGLLDLIERHADCYFQLFTNGHLLTDEVARRLARAGNVTPLLSVEGLEEESDRRRHGQDVFNHTLRGVHACRRAGLFFGLAASICRSNYHELLTREYLERAARLGAHYLWYYIYRPVGADPQPDNALTAEEIRGFRRFLVEQRQDAPLLLIETYWDADGHALCPGATGMSHHISPSGALEFCPPIQMAKDWIGSTGQDVGRLFESSAFLADFRHMVASTTRGCLLLEDPVSLADFLEYHHAQDTTSRQTVMREYRQMRPRPGHDLGADAMPEANPFYRWLKRRYFFGFGAYG